jgi:hypothetical protein
LRILSYLFILLFFLTLISGYLMRKNKS